jgi:hypothetical protein
MLGHFISQVVQRVERMNDLTTCDYNISCHNSRWHWKPDYRASRGYILERLKKQVGL